MTKEVGADGSIRYYNSDGNFHREDGPAVIYSNKSKLWFLNGELHREDGPAIIWEDGTKAWWLCDDCYDFNAYVNKIYPSGCHEKTMFIMKWS